MPESVGKVKKTDFFSKTRIQTIVVMLKLISLSGYLSFKKIALRLSHSSANRADDDERRRTRFSMVMKRDRFIGRLHGFHNGGGDPCSLLS